MATSQHVGGRSDDDPETPIYGAATTRASERAKRYSRGAGIIAGAAGGIACSLILDQLGVPHVFGFGDNAWLVPLCILGALTGVTRYALAAGAVSIGLLALLLLVSWTNIIVAPALGFIRHDPLPAHADAVVALSAGVTPDGYLTQQGTDRILSAASLVKAGVAPVLLVTHENRTMRGMEFNSSADQRRIAALASIPMVVTGGEVNSTHDEALEVAKVVSARKWGRVILVTSPFHTKRACATFEKAGLTVTCIPSDSRDIAVHRLQFSHERLQAFQMWLYETAGMVRYRQLGWI
jgi:uncharacterized SAM-binding protein YcdF (DUF218 family)